jgi:hypothetical protein
MEESIIHIKTITGKKIICPPMSNPTCLLVKEFVEKTEGIPVDIIRLIQNSKTLQDNDIITQQHPITNLHLMVNLRGGMFHETSGRKDIIPIKHAVCLQDINQSVCMIYNIMQTDYCQSKICKDCIASEITLK